VQIGFWWGDLRESENVEYLSLDGRIILKLIFEKWVRGMDWIDLDQDRDSWRSLMSAVMNTRVP
jgi:hypothetical protein